MRKQSGHVAAHGSRTGPSFAKILIATYKGIQKGTILNAQECLSRAALEHSIPTRASTKSWIEEYIQETRTIDPSVKFDEWAATLTSTDRSSSMAIFASFCGCWIAMARGQRLSISRRNPHPI